MNSQGKQEHTCAPQVASEIDQQDYWTLEAL